MSFLRHLSQRGHSFFLSIIIHEVTHIRTVNELYYCILHRHGKHYQTQMAIVDEQNSVQWNEVIEFKATMYVKKTKEARYRIITFIFY